MTNSKAFLDFGDLTPSQKISDLRVYDKTVAKAHDYANSTNLTYCKMLEVLVLMLVSQKDLYYSKIVENVVENATNKIAEKQLGND